MLYLDPINLPFNAAILRDGFIPVRPGEDVPEDDGYWIIIQGAAMVFRAENGSLSLHKGAVPSWVSMKMKPVCFGYWQNSPVYAVVVGKDQPVPAPFRPEPFNGTEDRLEGDLLTLGGMAMQILHWQRNSTCCSRCGGSLQNTSGSWGKQCVTCAYEHFPHISPCIIVLVRRGEQFLLGRKSVWPEGRYSLIAGFLDVGECLEECVHREVKEETGISVKNLRYVGSQNWPFPSQLMAGFIADYAGGEINFRGDELEDARWFTRDAMPASLPAKRSIARWIIDTHVFNGNTRHQNK